MTRAQLRAIIEDDLGYEFGQKIPLGEVSSFFQPNGTLLPNPKDILLEFDPTLDLIYIWKIETKEDGTIEYLSSQPSDCISFSTIEGAHLASTKYPNSGFGHRMV